MDEEFVGTDECLQERLWRKNGCSMQGPDGGWPCNTCFHAMEIPGLKHDIHDYWLAVLAIRGDYPHIEPRHELIDELYHALGA